MARSAFLQSLCDKLPPSPLVIITGNRDFVGIFQALKQRKFDVYLGYNDLAQGLFMSQATKAWHYFDLFGIDRDKRTKRKMGGKKRKTLRLRREREAEAETASEERKKAKMVKREEEEATDGKMQKGEKRKKKARRE
ncbi:unnamed protein product [Thlaspi arvense]|uniref:NYN domain-containing protein n=1 Tax=Thlaspi arvense TaxID=13288 RepID=A0AAU9SHM9_THLAR|nr:unnamed protein product [Thlaspi arvense]